MCLQWCYVRRWIIDNDWSCVGCDRGDPAALPDAPGCDSCVHRRDATCALTQMPLPLRRTCCHVQATLTDLGTRVLTDAALAPWLAHRHGIEGVFADSWSAPEVTLAPDGGVVVDLDRLSVPFVYGVPAEDWDAALPPTAPAAPGASAPEGMLRLIAALEADDAAVAGVLGELRDAGWPPVPVAWVGVAQDVLRLLRGRGNAALDVLMREWKESQSC